MKINYDGEMIECNEIIVKSNSIIIDGFERLGISDDTWNSIKCDEIDILSERQRAIDEAEKSKSILDRLSSQDEEIALLWYEKMQDESRIESNETEISNLYYDLMTGGVI